MRKIKKSLYSIYYVVILSILFIIGNIMKLRRKDLRNIWLISERGIDARDNAFVFYQSGGTMISQNLKHEMLKTIEVTRDTAQNNIQTALESYTEVIAKLNLLTYLLISEHEK